jgi:uncharacterized membrane protein YqiK
LRIKHSGFACQEACGLDGNPEELVEIKGCRTLADVIARAGIAKDEQDPQEEIKAGQKAIESNER